MVCTPRIRWENDQLVRFPTVDVELIADDRRCPQESTDKRFVAWKSREMIEQLLASLGPRQPRHILELGIFKGGSVVLYHELFRPRRMLAVDLAPEVPAPLLRYAENHPQLRLAPGVDQADSAALSDLCQESFEEEPLDLVIDDASHWYAPTRASFIELFPRLKPGGLYVIEDWGWAHWQDDFWQQGGGDNFCEQVPLSNLIMHLVLLAASAPQCLAGVVLNRKQAIIERGPAPMKPGFDLESMILSRGEALPWIGGANPWPEHKEATPIPEDPQSNLAATIKGNLDSPLDGEIITSGIRISGWALDMHGRVSSVEIALNGERVARIKVLVDRPDVVDHYRLKRNVEVRSECGFSYAIPRHKLKAGENQVSIVAINEREEKKLIGTRYVFSD